MIVYRHSWLSNMKYIFVTGGVVSDLGKGICAASLARLLKQRGYSVKNQNFDPYLNLAQQNHIHYSWI